MAMCASPQKQRKSVRPAVWRQLAGRGGGRTHKLRRAQR